MTVPGSQVARVCGGAQAWVVMRADNEAVGFSWVVMAAQVSWVMTSSRRYRGSLVPWCRLIPGMRRPRPQVPKVAKPAATLGAQEALGLRRRRASLQTVRLGTQLRLRLGLRPGLLATRLGLWPEPQHELRLRHELRRVRPRLGLRWRRDSRPAAPPRPTSGLQEQGLPFAAIPSAAVGWDLSGCLADLPLTGGWGGKSDWR